MRDNMEASAEDLHQLVLQNAFKSMSSLPEKVVICGKNNKVVAFNRDIMMLFSSFIRDMLSNIPCCTTNATNPIIILPEVHISTLIKLQDILHNGYCDEISDVLESNELLETTNLLGFNIKKLHVENKKKIGDKEAFINVDNVNMSKKEVRNLITQRQKEGNQVVLMRNSKAALPSLPASKLKSNMVKKAATPSSATSKISTKPPAPKPSPLPSKTPSITTPVNKTTTPSLEAAASTSASSMISPLSVPVKTEAPDEVVQPKTTESMEVDQITGNGGGGATAEKPQSLQISAPIIAKVEDTTVFQCEQCNKPFSTVILLKYHYCSHFMNLMKKNYGHLLDSKNSCQECKKNFQNSRRLLLHIGVNHDKINDILKSRGFKTLPPHSSSPPPPFSSSSSTNNSTDQPKEATKPAAEKVFDVRKMMDIKNVPLITPPATPTPVGSVPSTVTEKSKTISTETFKTISDPVNSNPKVMPSPGSSKPMSSSASVQPPGPSATPSSAASKPDTDVSKSQDTSQCNYDLECQVCKQKMNNLHQLEQHCCRHFMKELAEQFANLMEDLRCSLCNTIFKQKHKLLLHIGCKHGKINEVLKQKGYAVLPAPCLEKGNNAMQKELIKIKKEKMDKSDDSDSIVSKESINESLKSIVEDFDFSNSVEDAKSQANASSSSSVAASMPIINPGPFSTELSAILKKYSNLTQQSPSV